MTRNLIASLCIVTGLIGAGFSSGWIELPGSIVTPVDPAPIAVEGLHVVVVSEHSEGQSVLMQSLPIILADTVPVGKWRSLDDDLTAEQLRHLPMWVRDAMAVERGESPWVIIANGNRGYSGPLPATTDEIRKLIGRYGDGK